MLKTFIIYTLFMLTGALGILYYILSDKYSKQSLQVRILSKQVSTLTSQVSSANKASDSLQVFYSSYPFETGEILRKCSLQIAPLSSSNVLRILNSGTKVQVFDAVEALETLWYEVRVLSQDTINIKGFVRQEFVKELRIVETTTGPSTSLKQY